MSKNDIEARIERMAALLEKIGEGDFEGHEEIPVTDDPLGKLEQGLNDVVLDLNWDHCPLKLKEVDGEGRGTGSMVSYQKWTRYVSRPGNYELTFEDIDGFEAVPPRHVKISYGEIVPMVVPLTRRR